MMGKFSNKNWLTIFIALLAAGIFFVNTTFAGTLSCTIRTSACSGGEVEIFEMQNTTNSHAGLPAASYNNLVCCTGVGSLGTSCSGTFATVLKLSGATNAHARQNQLSDYAGANNVCISVPSGGTVSVGYQATNCTGFDTTLASMKATTNSHVGNTTAYTEYKICASAAAGLSSAIEIRAQNYTTSVPTITFPEGSPGATISQPYNNINGSGSPQTFGGAGTAKPVVTLYNGGASTLIIWYNISTFTNDIVISEYYLVNNKGAACADASCIANAATFDADTTAGTTIAAGAGNEKDLYLKAVLSSVAAKSGNSTLTILGEAL